MQLQQGLNGNALAQGFQGVLGQSGAQPAQDMRFFYDNLLKPYQDLFQAERGAVLGQAKESAGNLTGSGYNNILGASAAQSLAGEQALTAQTLMGLRQQELARQQDFLRLLFGFASQGVGPNQAAYQPGLLDAILPFAGQLGGQWLAGRNQGGNQMPSGPVPNIPSVGTGVYNIPNQFPTTTWNPMAPGGIQYGQPNYYRP